MPIFSNPVGKLRDQFKQDQDGVKQFSLSKTDQSFQATEDLIPTTIVEVQKNLKEKQQILIKAKSDRRRFIGSAIATSIVSGIGIAISSVVVLALSIVLSPIILGVGVIAAFLKTIPTKKDAVDKIQDKVEEKIKDKILKKIKEKTWDKIKNRSQQLKKAVVAAEVAVKKEEENIKESLETIKTIAQEIKQEKVTLETMTKLTSALKSSPINHTKVIQALGDAYSTSPELLLTILKNTKQETPADIGLLRASILDDSNILKLRDLLAEDKTSENFKNLLSIFLEGRADLFIEMLQMSKLAEPASKKNPAIAIVLAKAFSALHTLTSGDELVVQTPQLFIQLREAMRPNLTPEHFQAITAILNPHLKTLLKVKYDCLAGKPGTLNKTSFQQLIKDLDSDLELTDFSFKDYGVGLAPNNQVQQYVKYICVRNQLDRLKSQDPLTSVDVTNFTQLLEKYKNDLSVTHILQEYLKEELQYQNKIENLEQTIQELQEKMGPLLSQEQSDQIDSYLKDLQTKEKSKKPLSILDKLRGEKPIESSINPSQNELMNSYHCLRGEMGVLDKKSFRELTAKLEQDYTLRSFDFTKLKSAPNKNVQKYVENIVIRNRLIEIAKGLKNANPAMWQASATLFVATFLRMGHLDKEYLNPDYHLSAEYLSDTLKQIDQECQNEGSSSITTILQTSLKGDPNNPNIQENAKTVVQSLRTLDEQNPKACNALFRYHFKDTPDAEAKVQIILGLLRAEELFKATDPALADKILLITYNTMNQWKNKSLSDLQTEINNHGINLDKKPGPFSRGLDAKFIRVVHEAVGKQKKLAEKEHPVEKTPSTSVGLGH